MAGYANGDPANTREVASSIDGRSVSRLDLSWSRSIKAAGAGLGFTGSPVVVDRVVYLQDPDSNVRAMELDSGRVLWEKRYDSPAEGPIGLVVAEGKVFGATPNGAFALDAETGEEEWFADLVPDEAERIAMTPGYHDGLVYLSTVPVGEKGGAIGVLWALEAESGERVWHFNTAPKNLWGNPDLNYGGGLTHPPAFDGEGSMYVGTGNPGPIPGTEEYPWGTSRPGPNLYTQSIVKLDEKTGKVEWHYQVVPHGLCNWDVGGPVLAEVGGRKVVVAAGLSGLVVAVDRETGKLLWKRPVGIHNGHDNDGVMAMRGELERLKLPMTVFPGAFGGVAGPLAVDDATVFVPVINNPTTLDDQGGATLSEVFRGELVALDLITGDVKWKRRFFRALYGPVTVTNDLVFAISFGGEVHAFDTASGDEVWSESLSSQAEGGMAVTGATILVRAGFPSGSEPTKLMAYRIAG